MKYLADTSAVVRIDRGQLDSEWADVVEQARIAVCEPVLAETLTLADTKRYAAVELTLLHEDGDFETIARFIPELKQLRISTQP